MKKISTILISFLILSSCASPTVINVIGPNDTNLNCKELSAEIVKANRYADEAQDAKQMNKSHNIASILFFFPGAVITMKNVDEATDAARERASHLSTLKERKKC